MKLRAFLILLLCSLLLTGFFTGCGAAVNKSDFGSFGEMESAESIVEAKPNEIVNSDQLVTGDTATQAVLPQNQKLIITMYMNAETEDLDALLSWIDARLAETGGYMEEQSVYKGSSSSYSRNRYANLVLRIPATKLDAFALQLEDSANVISREKTTDNITLSYVATQSRITALETEQTRLLELLAKAADMKDLLLIEERLTQVRTELEQVTSQLRLYDNLVDYSTLHLSINEVREYTEPAEEPETLGQRIAAGFSKSMTNLGNALTEIFVFFVTRLPYLIPAGVVALIAFVILLLTRRKKAKKETPPQEDQPKA